MGPRVHDAAAHAAFMYLLRRGHRVAWEVGIVGGRIDLVRLDAKDNWVELYEVKLHRAEKGIPQILRYAAGVDGDPELTLVVPPSEATRELRAQAAEHGVSVWKFDWEAHANVEPNGRGEMVHLPSLSAEALERITAANAAWNQTPAAAESRERVREFMRQRRARALSDGERAAA